MTPRAQQAQSMQEEQIREALNSYWRASAAVAANAEHDIYDDDAVVITLRQVNESAGGVIYRPCGAIIQASRRASM